ncbi:hypothetical protein Tco_1552978 [Tanacetum coccineum]
MRPFTLRPSVILQAASKHAPDIVPCSRNSGSEPITLKEVLGGVEGEGVGRDEVAMGRGGATVDPGVGELATAQRRKI